MIVLLNPFLTKRVDLADDDLKLIKPLNDVTLKSLNQDAVFQCELSAANRRVSWFLNGKQVSIGKKFVFENIENVYQLTVTNASRDDIGSIKMTCGTIDTKGQLKIESKLDENFSRNSRYFSFLSKMYCIERIFETLLKHYQTGEDSAIISFTSILFQLSRN